MRIISRSPVFFLLLAFLSLAACAGGSGDDDTGSTALPGDDDSAGDDTGDDDAADDDLFDDDATDDDTALDDDAADDDISDDDIADDDDAIDDDSAADDDIIDDDTTPTDDTDPDDDSALDDDTAPPACETYGSPQAVGTLGTTNLTETSGFAVSRRNPGVLWAHNDSGDGPYLYAMTFDGTFLGRLELTGATATDWEDMAAGPCGADQCLYVGDTGDNSVSRTDARVYRVWEPEVDPAVPFGEMTTTDWEVFPFSYPDGPRDAESLAVHPDGRVYVFSKYPYGTSEMYVFPALTPDTPVVLTHLGDFDTGGGIAMTTAADIHPNGMRLLLRTYLTVMEWRLPPGEDFNDLPTVGVLHAAPSGLELQGESIAYVPEDGGYLHTSEGQGATIYRVSCNDGRF